MVGEENLIKSIKKIWKNKVQMIMEENLPWLPDGLPLADDDAS